MNKFADQQPLIVITGPSAVGKTEIAIRLAERLKAEIVSADSTLIYRGMDIGTAKPTKADRDRVPHHLIDVANPDENWSLADYQARATQALKQIHSRHVLPFLVGGAGQYVRSIVEGWDIPKVAPDHRMRKALQNWMSQIGPEGLYARLEVIDPWAASKIDPHNFRRTIRALEVVFSTGRKFSEQRTHINKSYRLLIIGLTRPRVIIYQRVDQRIDQMIRNGLVDEVRDLLQQGYPDNLPAFSAIGYRELIEHIKGRITLQEAVTQMKKRTRVFIRHQANWFKLDDPAISWYEVADTTVDDLETEIRNWLNQ